MSSRKPITAKAPAADTPAGSPARSGVSKAAVGSGSIARRRVGAMLMGRETGKMWVNNEIYR